jgi:hypothetical protein
MSITAPTWGPQVAIRPILAEELDELSSSHSDVDDESVDWRERDVCLLGNDFLCQVTVILDGIERRLVVADRSLLS